MARSADGSAVKSAWHSSLLRELKVPSLKTLSPARVLPKVHFLEQLRLEKLRSSRSDTPMSVIFLNVRCSLAIRPSLIIEFLTYVHDRVRETDILGFLGESAVGLILPNTNQEGARILAETLTLDRWSGLVDADVLAYPERLLQESSGLGVEEGFRCPIQLVVPSDSRRFSRGVKRAIDIFGSLLGLFSLSPLMFVVAVLIKSESKGAIIFTQVRLGLRGKPFLFYKFRSMYSNADEELHRKYVLSLIRGETGETNQGDVTQPLYKIKNDPRVTRIGAVLRRFSLDELPQLFNVLRGDMSLVGPRPPLPYETEAYQAWHLRRISEIKPGITGLWQVSGRSAMTFEEMVRLDIRYIQEWSLLLDIKILFKTLKAVVRPRAAL